MISFINGILNGQIIETETDFLGLGRGENWGAMVQVSVMQNKQFLKIY